MTEQEQRIAIAEFCGWKDCFLSPGIGVTGNRPSPMDVYARALIPDFLHDLNAMHEAERTLEFPEAYASILDAILLRDGAASNFDGTIKWYFAFAFATAAQRAEALLKTIGKWKD